MFLFIYAVLKMRWTPLSVQTGLLNSPTWRANVASSKGFCIWPRSKYPKSPPRLALVQSEWFVANADKVSWPDSILCWKSVNIFKASSFDLVICSCIRISIQKIQENDNLLFTSLQELGLLDSLLLINKWLARTRSSSPFKTGASHRDSFVTVL